MIGMIGIIGVSHDPCLSIKVGDSIYGQMGREYIVEEILEGDWLCKSHRVPKYKVRYAGTNRKKIMEDHQIYCDAKEHKLGGDCSHWYMDFMCGTCCNIKELIV